MAFGLLKELSCFFFLFTRQHLTNNSGVLELSISCRVVKDNSRNPEYTVKGHTLITTVYKLASDNGFSQKIFVWRTPEKLLSCQNLDLSLS